MSSHDLTLCLKLMSIHTLDAGQRVELKWVVSPCGNVVGGDLIVRLEPATESERYMLGDVLFIHGRAA